MDEWVAHSIPDSDEAAVLRRITEAVLAEREACAKIAEDESSGGFLRVRLVIAAKIRARQ